MNTHSSKARKRSLGRMNNLCICDWSILYPEHADTCPANPGNLPKAASANPALSLFPVQEVEAMKGQEVEPETVERTEGEKILCSVTLFQLIAAKYAIRLERLGMKHSSRRSARKHWAMHLGLSPHASFDEVLERIETILEAVKKERGIEDGNLHDESNIRG